MRICTFMNGPMMRIFIDALYLWVGLWSGYLSMYYIYEWAHDENICIYEWAHGNYILHYEWAYDQNLYLCTVFMSGPIILIFIYALHLWMGPWSGHLSMYYIYEWAHGWNIYLCTTFMGGPMMRIFINALHLWVGQW